MNGAWLKSKREALNRAFERRPFLVAAALSGLAIWAADGAWWIGAGGFLFGAGLLLWARPLVSASCLIGLAILSGALHRDDVQNRAQLRDQVGQRAAIVASVRVIEPPRVHETMWSAQVDDTRIRARYLLRAGGTPPSKGAVLKVRGVLRPIQPPRNPGEFDRLKWLDRSGVALELEADQPPDVLEAPPPRSDFAAGIRSWFREAIVRGLDPQSDEAVLIRAVVLGERPEDDALIERFWLTGTLHVFAVSGLHVGMVGLIAWIILRFCGVSRRRAVVPLMMLMFAYAWLTGMKPPALRAACMASLWLGAFIFRRRPNVANALGLVALAMLVFDGDLLFKAGAQLSFGVVAVISLLHPHVAKCFGFLTRTEPYLPRSLYSKWREKWLKCRQRTADLLTVSTSAWLGSAPLTAWHFGIFTPMAVVASAVLSLMVFGLLSIALVSVLVSPIPYASPGLNHANGAIAKLILGTTDVAAKVPGGHVMLPRDRPAGDFVTVYDLGQGGASVWHLDGDTGLIDGGSAWQYRYTLRPSLERMALRPTSVIATHPDGRHVGGLAAAWKDFPIQRAMSPVVRAIGPGFRDWVQTGREHPGRLIRGRKNRRYQIAEGVFFEVSYEPDPWNWRQLADDRVMPVRLHWHGWKILFMSDAGWATERAMMNGGHDFAADVVIAGRHAYDASLSDAFLDACGARAVVVSHRAFPPEQRVPETWRRQVEARGIAVFHQGESGAVILSREDEALVLRGWLDGKYIALEPGQRAK